MKILFIHSFFFGWLLCNHSFQIKPKQCTLTHLNFFNYTASLHSLYNSVSYEINKETVEDAPVKCSENPENCFAGAILKTEDGGKTWNKVWENVNTGDNIYNNGIHCSSVTHCVAAVEGDTGKYSIKLKNN